METYFANLRATSGAMEIVLRQDDYSSMSTPRSMVRKSNMKKPSSCPNYDPPNRPCRKASREDLSDVGCGYGSVSSFRTMGGSFLSSSGTHHGGIRMRDTKTLRDFYDEVAPGHSSNNNNNKDGNRSTSPFSSPTTRASRQKHANATWGEQTTTSTGSTSATDGDWNSFVGGDYEEPMIISSPSSSSSRRNSRMRLRNAAASAVAAGARSARASADAAAAANANNGANHRQVDRSLLFQGMVSEVLQCHNDILGPHRSDDDPRVLQVKKQLSEYLKAVEGLVVEQQQHNNNNNNGLNNNNNNNSYSHNKFSHQNFSPVATSKFLLSQLQNQQGFASPTQHQHQQHKIQLSPRQSPLSVTAPDMEVPVPTPVSSVSSPSKMSPSKRMVTSSSSPPQGGSGNNKKDSRWMAARPDSMRLVSVVSADEHHQPPSPTATATAN